MAQEAANLVKTIFSSGGSLAGKLAQATLDVLTLSFLIFVVSIYIAAICRAWAIPFVMWPSSPVIDKTRNA